MKTQNSCNFNPLLKYHVHMKNELAQSGSNIIGLKRLVMTCGDTNGAKKVKLLMAR